MEVLLGKSQETVPVVVLGRSGEIIIKWIFQKEDVKLRIGINRQRIWPNGGLL
jgi:hypothetical protein